MRSSPVASLTLLVLSAAHANASEPAPVQPGANTHFVLAQYFDGGGSGAGPAEGEGYLPDTRREPVGDPDIMNPRTRQPILLGLSLGLGAAFSSLNAVDDTFFTPNDAYTLGSRVMPSFELSGYIEIQEVFRVGFLGQAMVGGSVERSMGVSSGGILLEGGGGDRTRVFGGVVIGGMNARAESESLGVGITSEQDIREYEWQAGFISYRFHVHVERQINPWVAVRATPWVLLGTRLGEDFEVPLPREAPSNTIPRDTGLSFGAAGLSLSFVFGTGRQ
jgi:hypothetical protein